MHGLKDLTKKKLKVNSTLKRDCHGDNERQSTEREWERCVEKLSDNVFKIA